MKSHIIRNRTFPTIAMLGAAYCVCVLASGCRNGIGEGWASAIAPLRKSWKDVNEFPSAEEFKPWQWAPLIPHDMDRAELIGAIVPESRMRALAADLPAREIMLTSGTSLNEAYRVVNVNGIRITNCQDLFRSLDAIPIRQEAVQVDVRQIRADTSESQDIALMVDRATFNDLTSEIAPHNSRMRILDGDNAWFVHRSASLLLRLTGRVEPTRGLVHVVVSLTNTGDEPVLTPSDVRAFCDGQPMKCLNVSETLDVLYGEPDWINQSASVEHTSFSTVSESDEYLLPVNFQKLDDRMNKLFRNKSHSPPQPALAGIPGETYPGSAVLGDARALTQFLLRRDLLQPNAPEKIGWIMFSHRDLSTARVIEILVDMPEGTAQVSLNIPSTEVGKVSTKTKASD